MKAVIFGATSAIAAAAARNWACRGADFFLVARNSEQLESVRRDLEARGASKVKTATADLSVTQGHEALFLQIEEELPAYDTVLIAYGSLPDQKSCEDDFSHAEKEIQTNFTSIVSLLTLVAKNFEERGGGTIAVISSVAGDRGRQSNYVYGSAKGALSIFLQGLRNRLARRRVNVITIKPGFVDTPMTAGLKKGLLFASARTVGEGICRAVDKKRDVVYLPWFWRPIMLVIRHIPERIFKKMRL